jgi:hypothetical protein
MLMKLKVLLILKLLNKIIFIYIKRYLCYNKNINEKEAQEAQVLTLSFFFL